MPRWASRTDKTHKPLSKVLRQLGCDVLDLSRVGQGCPDTAVHISGHVYLVEFKSLIGKRKPKAAPLTKDQKPFHAIWPVVVLASAEEAIQWVQQQRGRR